MVVIDASVAVRWVVQHPLTANADLLIERHDIRLAPQIIVSEVGNALWKYVRANIITANQARRAMEEIPGRFVTLEQDADHARRAMELAIELDHPFYDCLYLAVAEARQAPLVTDDQRLLNKLARKRRIKVIALADIR